MNFERVSKVYKTGRENPKKTLVISLILLAGLLAGMYQAADQPLNNENATDDFDYGELDPQPENETNPTNSTNDTNDSINVTVTNKTCVEKHNESYCVTG